MAFEIRYYNANSEQRRYRIRHWIPMYFFLTPCRFKKHLSSSSLCGEKLTMLQRSPFLVESTLGLLGHPSSQTLGSSNINMLYHLQNYKNVCPKVINFCKFFKMREKKLCCTLTFLFVILYCTQRRCSQIQPKLKVEIKDVSKAESLVYLYTLYTLLYCLSVCFSFISNNRQKSWTDHRFLWDLARGRKRHVCVSVPKECV